MARPDDRSGRYALLSRIAGRWRVTDFSHTPEAIKRRKLKASKLADFMIDHRFLRAPEPDERRSVELSAGVNPGSSDETWALAIELWQVRVQAAADEKAGAST